MRTIAPFVICLVSAGMARAEAAVQDYKGVGPAWQAAWNAKRGNDAASLFTADGVFVHATGESVTGKPAIWALFAKVLAVNTPMIEMTPLAQAQAGDAAWVTGKYRETIAKVDGSATINVHGQYLLVLHQAPKTGWLIERMMWSDEH
jgi:uncharacterized protein (TIGR02246 family)